MIKYGNGFYAFKVYKSLCKHLDPTRNLLYKDVIKRIIINSFNKRPDAYCFARVESLLSEDKIYNFYLSNLLRYGQTFFDVYTFSNNCNENKVYKDYLNDIEDYEKTFNKTLRYIYRKYGEEYLTNPSVIKDLQMGDISIVGLGILDILSNFTNNILGDSFINDLVGRIKRYRLLIEGDINYEYFIKKYKTLLSQLRKNVKLEEELKG